MLKKLAISACLLAVPTTAFADPIEKPFVKKRYSIQGTAKVETVNDEMQLVFSKDFKTKSGPDLKVYLSKSPLSTLSAQDVDENAVRLSVLKSHKGEQRYTIPATIDLSQYQSIVIQCESYDVLWGGFDL